MCQGSSSARDPGQALAMEMRVGTVETAGKTERRGGGGPQSLLHTWAPGEEATSGLCPGEL